MILIPILRSLACFLCGNIILREIVFFFQTDHTTGDRNGYYISLSRDTVQQPGDRGNIYSHYFDHNLFTNFRHLCICFLIIFS